MSLFPFKEHHALGDFLLVCILTADEEFDELCFDFGIELDEVVSFRYTLP